MVRLMCEACGIEVAHCSEPQAVHVAASYCRGCRWKTRSPIGGAS